MRNVLTSKKVWVSLAGLVFAVASVLLGRDVPPEIQTHLLTIIGSVVATFNLGQSIADGWSMGNTSASKKEGS